MNEQTCVVFGVDSQKYCVDILKVSEIGMNKETVTLPNVPPFVEGVINLRGDVLCIINLAKKLDKISRVGKEHQKIIVVEIRGTLVGFLVDEVTGIIHIKSEDYERTPSIVSQSSYFMDGIVKSGEEMIVALDLNKVLNESEIETIEKLNKEQAI